MISLEEAITLARKAHEDQWRKPKFATEKQYTSNRVNKLSVGNYILEDGNNLFAQNDIWYIREPYITHPLAVMNMMTTEEEKIVAVLHDVLEDTNLTYQHLLDNDFGELSDTARNALKLLTKHKEQSYELYIFNISCCRFARKIKLADIFHNMSDNPSEQAKQKYLKAIPILLQNL